MRLPRLMDAPRSRVVYAVTLPLPDCCGDVTESPYQEGNVRMAGERLQPSQLAEMLRRTQGGE